MVRVDTLLSFSLYATNNLSHLFLPVNRKFRIVYLIVYLLFPMQNTARTPGPV